MFSTARSPRRPSRHARTLRLSCALSALWLLSTAPTAQSPTAGPATAPAPGATSAPSAFVEGLAALHSFEYEDANAAFLRAQRDAPAFALGYWGEAMTYHQTLWGNEDVAAGRRALARLGATPAATPRDQAYLAAAGVLFGDGDGATRRQRYADAMAGLHASDPGDPDTASFYALALLGTASRSLIGYVDSHEGHSASLAGSPTQARVGDILGRVLASHPGHAGALHYLLHNYDDPEHARLGLDAARAYAKVAPESSHALHMPAHIFLQLGMWADAEASDRAAFAASERWVARKGLPPAMRSYHALAWRQYELLQLGRVKEARALIDVVAPVVKATGDLTLLSDLSSMRARQVLETRNWTAMANERNFGNALELAAIGVSAARSGNAPLAELARQGLATRATAAQEGDLRPAIAIMERQVAGMMALAAGRADEAVEILRAATGDELRLPPPLGLPIPIVPAPELLGDVLLEVRRPKEALEAFGQALARNANRTRSVLGMARASAALGQADAARQQYRTLLESYANADPDQPEIAEARAALAGANTPPVPAPSTTRRGSVGTLTVVAVVAVALAGGWLLWRRRSSPAGQASLPRAERRRRGRSRK